MWRCPNCGKQIGDEFDACWKCGTAQDGTRAADFHAESDDPATSDLEPDSEPSLTEEEREADRILNDRLVEVCSAGNIVEADGLCELLEEAGIQARVVGEGLGVAAGGLALGENVSPRIWVHERDLARAQEVIEQWRTRQTNEPVELPGSETPPESERPVEAEYAELPSDVRLRFLSQGFFIAGSVCILIGAVWAWGNSMKLSTCSATTVGRLSRTQLGDVKPASLPAPSERDLPPGPVKQQWSFSLNAEYVYVVNGQRYYAHITVDHRDEAPDQIAIRYDPHDPLTNVIGSIAPPWMILLFAAMVGMFLCFVGYQFR
jgi:hypothetical protein